MERIVVIQTAFLGDLLLSIPLLKQIKIDKPHSFLTLVCRAGLGSIFIELGLVEEVIEVQKGNSNSYKSALSKLNGNKNSIVIAPHMSLRTAFFSFRIRADLKISFFKPWSFWAYNQTLKWPQEWPEALRQLSLWRNQNVELNQRMNSSESFDFKKLSTEISSFKKLKNIPSWSSLNIRSLILSYSAAENIKNKILSLGLADKDQNRRILIFPGSVWPTKKWISEGYMQLALSLVRQGHQVVWMGGPGEEILTQDLHRRTPGTFNLGGKTTLLESLCLISQSDLVVGNDSASSHLAATVNTPVISIFGPTVLRFGYRPWSDQSYIIERSELECRPCGKHGSQKCPRGTHECMTHISAKEVIDLVNSLLILNP